MKITELMMVLKLQITVNETSLFWVEDIQKWRVTSKKRVPNETGFTQVVNGEFDNEDDAVAEFSLQCFTQRKRFGD